MRTVLAVTAVAAFVTPAAAQRPPGDWSYKRDVFLPIVDPTGDPNVPPFRITPNWQYTTDWSNTTEWATRVPGPGSENVFYVPLGHIDAVTQGNILDPSYNASFGTPFGVTVQIRDRSGATGTLWFDGDLNITWHGADDVRYAYASGSIGTSPDYHQNLTLGSTTYDVTLGFGWGPWYAPGWDDRPSSSQSPSGHEEWTGQAGEFSLLVREAHNSPEPATLMLAGLGCGALVSVRAARRRRATTA